MNKILCLIIILGLGTFQKSYSQKEASKWIFGINAGIDFLTTPPTILQISGYNSNEGIASIADSLGNLLFYTNGNTVWNKNQNIMPNGTGLFGGASSTQSSLIIKQPGNKNIYFIFNTESEPAVGGLYYSTVDLNLAGGNGSVTTKNNPLPTPVTTERLAGVKHCNGIDFWVVTHDLDTNIFRTFLVSSNGISANPILSSIGQNIIGTIGTMKIAPNGKKIGLSEFLSGPGNCQLFDFDNVTGTVSNPILLYNIIDRAYGLEFSPDNTKLYCAGHGPGTQIFQWDLSSGINLNILNSRVIISPGTMFWTTTLQLALDGKIYICTPANWLAAINFPNIGGIGCNLVSSSLSYSPGSGAQGLPNFVSSYFDNSPHIASSAQCRNDTIICSNTNINVGNNSNDCAVYSWQPNIALTCTNCPNPIASPTTTTKYYVNKTYYGVTTKDSLLVTIFQPSVIANAGINHTLCLNSNVQLGVSDSTKFTSYKWIPNTFLNCTACPSPISNPSANITYTLQKSECSSSATSTVNVRVKECETTYFVPNIFTPNNDGTNETWSIQFNQTDSVKKFNLYIYNIWGTLIFENDKPGAKWDGHTSSGDECSVGIYFYVASFELKGEKKDFKGNVTLIR